MRWAVTVRVLLLSRGQGLNVPLLSGCNSRTVTSQVRMKIPMRRERERHPAGKGL